MTTGVLAPGTKLGPYEVLGPLGRGGMGEVYRARDTRLGREVAIKTLPDAFARDPERLGRFEREARLLASLTHPNIAGIHGLEETGGSRHLILEFVEGETLADRLTRGPLPVDETVEIARQIAAALEAAHEAGIVHRDLKPGNVMLTPAGTVKVLDFGLAKGGASAGGSSDVNISASPTLTYAPTDIGVILGTAAYMSPEQARGRTVDRRTDIWSFGCVVYECLTGKQLFAGETISDTVARILEREPDWNALPPRTPQRLRDLLRRCLEKDSRKRLRDIGDARIELEEIAALGVSGLAQGTGAGAGTAGAAASDRSAAAARRAAWLPWGVAGVGIALAALSFLLPGRASRSPGGAVMRSSVLAPSGFVVSTRPEDAALSPDGRSIVMVVTDAAGLKGQLWIRPLDALEGRPVPGAQLSSLGVGGGMPFWSPDGNTIAYFSDGKLTTIPAVGGTPQVLCSAPDARGGSWGKQGVILFSPTNNGPLYRIRASGGDPVQATELDSAAGETGHRFPHFLPDGRRFTYTSLPPVDVRLDTWIGTLGNDQRTKLIRAESGARFVPPDHLVYVRDRKLMAQRVDRSSLAPRGEPMPIGDSPQDLQTLGMSPAAASETGTLLFPTTLPQALRAIWLGPGGRKVGDLPIPTADYREFSFSPDGKRVCAVRYETGTTSDLWVADVEHGTMSRLTTDGVLREAVVWSPDGSRIAYTRPDGAVRSIYMLPSSGGGEEELIYKSSSYFLGLDDWTADGRYLIFETRDPVTQTDLWILPLEGDRKPVSYLKTRFSEFGASVSPDGSWIQYVSDESGQPDLYVQSFPTPGNKKRLTRDGVVGGGWRRDGRAIGYGSGLKIWEAPVRSGATLEVGDPVQIFELPINVRAVGFPRDFSRVLVGLPEGDPVPPRYTLLTNWSALTVPGR